MEEHRTARIADRRSEYQQRQMKMVLTPERHDPFAGLLIYAYIYILYYTYIYIHYNYIL